MTTFTNREIVENILPALRELGARELKPLGNLRIYQVRKAFMAHWADVDAIRMNILRHRATPGEDGRFVLDIVGNVIFDQDPAKAAKQQAAFGAAYAELLTGTFEYELTISLEEHIGENIPPGNVLLGLGELLVVETAEAVLPEEPGEKESEVTDDETGGPCPGE